MRFIWRAAREEIFPLFTGAFSPVFPKEKGWMESRKCLFCGGRSVQERFRASDPATGDEFGIVFCGECGNGFTFPQPENLDKYYPSDYRIFVGPVESLFKASYRSFVKRVTRTVGVTGRILEIGCGSGWMLKAFQEQGWEAVGLERTAEFARGVASQTGLEIHSDDIAEFDPKGGFDLILMVNVLEHLPEPLKTLDQCRTRLKAGGLLIVVFSDSRSWQARLFRSRWAHLDVPRHLFHLSRWALSAALEQQGFSIVASRNTSFVHDLYGWIQSLLNVLGFPGNQIQINLTKINRLRDALTPANAAIAAVAGATLLPFAFLALVSWVFRSGPIAEVWARRKGG